MKIKITEEGQPCRHCETPVIKRSHDKPRRRKQLYWFRFWFYCPNCGAMYMVNEAKVLNDDQIVVDTPNQKHSPESVKQKKRKSKKGKLCQLPRWVYVFDTGIRKDNRGTFKIGISVNLTDREKALKAGNPLGKILFAGFADAAMRIEKELHDIYRMQNIERELFSFAKSDLFVIRGNLKSKANDWYQSWSKT